jgi:ankyrin repeat protein
LAIVDALLKRKDIDVAAQDTMGRTALILAELYNHPDMVKALISHQVDKWLNTKQVANVEGDTPMALPTLPLLSLITRDRI